MPGALTQHFLEGRRRPYLSPIKLYLVCAAVFFLAAPVAGFSLESMLDADRSGALKALVSARQSERHLAPGGSPSASIWSSPSTTFRSCFFSPSSPAPASAWARR